MRLSNARENFSPDLIVGRAVEGSNRDRDQPPCLCISSASGGSEDASLGIWIVATTSGQSSNSLTIPIESVR